MHDCVETHNIRPVIEVPHQCKKIEQGPNFLKVDHAVQINTSWARRNLVHKEIEQFDNLFLSESKSHF